MIYQDSRFLVLQTNHYSYVISLNAPAPLGIYWGPKIDARDAECLHPLNDRSSFEQEMWRASLEYPAFDGRTFGTVALQADCPLFLTTAGVETDGEELRIHMEDAQAGIRVTLEYRVYPEFDTIRRSVSISAVNEPVRVRKFFTASVPLPEGAETVQYVSGCWAGEFRRFRQPIGPGMLTLENAKGMSGPDSSPFLMLTESDMEESGNAYAAMLEWSGPWTMQVKREILGGGRLAGGWNARDLNIDLQPGEGLKSPAMYLSASPCGIGGLSRTMHDLERCEIARPRHARRVLYNSWEATEFQVRCEEQMALAERAAQLGVELFVIDDGWFGQRNSDRAGLGDWYVNPEKFPDGLEVLIERVHALGMKFGIWVEPESVNPDSDLYRAHPDWIFRLPGREPVTMRNQYLLDMGKPEVEAFALNMLRDLMSRYRIDYFKWDMNRPLTDASEEIAPMAREKQVLAVYRILEKLRSEYPDLDIEACSGGGGRADMGMISRTDQFWVSDNTDPYDRLRIQEGSSLCYAPVYTSCWVTDTPAWAHKKGRDSLKYKFHVAMMGTLGIGANINRYSDEQMKEAAEWIGKYKKIRALVHEGDLYRLSLPSCANICANMFVAKNREAFVLFAFLHAQEYGDRCPRLYLSGLNPDFLYVCEETGEKRYGSTLMHAGIEPGLRGDFDSLMMHWTAAEETGEKD